MGTVFQQVVVSAPGAPKTPQELTAVTPPTSVVLHGDRIGAAPTGGAGNDSTVNFGASGSRGTGVVATAVVATASVFPSQFAVLNRYRNEAFTRGS